MSYSLTSMNPVCTSPSANISCEASLPRNSMLVPTPATYGSVKMGTEWSGVKVWRYSYIERAKVTGRHAQNKRVSMVCVLTW